MVVTAESNPGESAPRRASGSRRERRESPYKPYTPREPSMCKSEGWRKDAHRMYAFLLAQSDPDISAEEAEKLITPVLDHMWRSRARWYWLKEDNPVEFSRLLNDLFQEIHNRRIPGMDSYVRWIKPGSWYHRSVLEREELNRCPHLQYAPHLPPNVTRPSDATLRSYRAAFEKSLKTKKQILKNRRIYAATLRLHGRTAEADEIDPPRPTSVAPTPTPAPAPPRSQQSVPMEVDRRESPPTSGSRSTATNRSLPQDQTRQSERSEELVYSRAGGDATSRPTSNLSWGDQMSADKGAGAAAEPGEWQTARSKSSKRRRDPSSDHPQQQRLRKESRSPQPFPLRSRHEERVSQVLQLYEAAGQLERASCRWVRKIVKSRYPKKTLKEIVYITNVVVTMISEFHLTSSCLSEKQCCPVVPPFMEDELPLLEEYVSEAERETQDARVWNEAATKRIAVWLHRLETIAFHGEEKSLSILEQDHDDCELVKFLMDVGTCTFSEAEVVARVIAENVERIYGLLRKTQRSLNRAQSLLDGLKEKERNVEVELGNIPEGHPSRGAKSDELLQIRNQMERTRATLEVHSEKLDSLDNQLIEAGLKTPPESSDDEDDASSSEASLEAEMETGEAQEEEEEAEDDASVPMDDGGAEAAAAAEGEETNKAGAEEEDDGDVTEAENRLLDTPPPPNSESMDPDSTDPAGQESQVPPAQDRQA